MNEFFTLRQDGAVAHLQLSRPERMNTLSPAFFPALRDAVRGPHGVDHESQVVEQGIVPVDAPAVAAAAPVAAVVVRDHAPAPALERRGHMGITPGVFAQAMHDQHRAAWLGARPLVEMEHKAVGGGQGRWHGRECRQARLSRPGLTRPLAALA